MRRGAGELRLRLQALYLPLIYYLRDFCVGRALCREQSELFRGLRRVRQGRALLPHRLSFRDDLVGVVDDAIERGGAHRGIYDVGVPVLHRQLPGDDGLRVEDLGFRLVGSRSAPGWFKACGRRNDARRVPEAPVPR